MEPSENKARRQIAARDKELAELKAKNKKAVLQVIADSNKLQLEAAEKIRQLQAENESLKAALIWSEKFDGNILVKDMREFLQALKASKET